MQSSSGPQPLSYIAVLLVAVIVVIVSLIVLVRNQVSLEATANEQARHALGATVAAEDLSTGVRNARSVLDRASSDTRVCSLTSVGGRFVSGGELTIDIVCEAENATATATATGRIGKFRSVDG